MKGVYRTRVGYTGGTSAAPTYRDMGDHTESLQVDFDSAQISFEELARLFWQMHNPCSAPYSRQYMSAIWFHDDEQKRVLEDTKATTEQSLSESVQTPVLPLDKLYPAENYHQKYRLQSLPSLMDEFNLMYPDFEDFNNSTAAARLNGFASGKGSKHVFEQEFLSYGLPEALARSVVRF